MKKFITTFALALVAVASFAQKPLFRPRMEIAEMSSDNGNLEMEVFYMNDVEPRTYWLSVGHLGIGTEIIQVDFDPVYELFIPLGHDLNEVVAKMEEMKAMYKQKGESFEMQGCFSVAYPDENELETVTVTSKRSLGSKLLEFSLPTKSDGVIRATYIAKMDFGGLLSGVKFYRKLHPKE